MKIIENKYCLVSEQSAACSTIVCRGGVVNKLYIFNVLSIVLFIFVSAALAKAEANTVTLKFEVEGFNLKSGEIVNLIQRHSSKSDIFIAYNSRFMPHAILMMMTQGMEMAIVKDVEMSQVNVDSIRDLGFSTRSVDQPLNEGNTVVVRMADGSIYKIGNVVEHESSITFSYEQL